MENFLPVFSLVGEILGLDMEEVCIVVALLGDGRILWCEEEGGILKFSANEDSRGFGGLGMFALYLGVGIDGAGEVGSEEKERSVWSI